jgi:Antitoxin of toxin-antitoxin, RelE / RelB, TA system
MSSSLGVLARQDSSTWSDDDDLDWEEVVSSPKQTAVPLPMSKMEPPRPSPVKDIVNTVLEQGIGEEVLEQLADALAKVYRFNPEVRFATDGAAYIWLPEFAIYSEGPSFDDAAWALVDEALDYAADWEQQLHMAPNHRGREQWVRLIRMTRTREKVYRLLFGNAAKTS